MKTYHRAVAGLLSLTIGLAGLARSERENRDVSIDFGSPSGYTDIEIEGYSGDREQRIVLEAIRSEMEDQARLYLPIEYALEVRVDDIDLAGYYEPMYPKYDRVRIMRATYPPRFDFRFAVREAEGGVLLEGERSLADLNFLWRLDLPSRKQETAYYVRSLLKDWARSELAPLGK